MSSQQFPMQEYCKNDKTKNFCKGLMARLTKRILVLGQEIKQYFMLFAVYFMIAFNK